MDKEVRGKTGGSCGEYDDGVWQTLGQLRWRLWVAFHKGAGDRGFTLTLTLATVPSRTLTSIKQVTSALNVCRTETCPLSLVFCEKMHGTHYPSALNVICLHRPLNTVYGQVLCHVHLDYKAIRHLGEICC